MFLLVPLRVNSRLPNPKIENLCERNEKLLWLPPRRKNNKTEVKIFEHFSLVSRREIKQGKPHSKLGSIVKYFQTVEANSFSFLARPN